MILNVYNFRDERANEFGTPIFTQDIPEQLSDKYEKTVRELHAKISRLTEANINDPKLGELVLQSASLKDCVCYHVGTFDSKTGAYKIFDDAVLVCRLSDFYIGA